MAETTAKTGRLEVSRANSMAVLWVLDSDWIMNFETTPGFDLAGFDQPIAFAGVKLKEKKIKFSPSAFRLALIS